MMKRRNELEWTPMVDYSSSSSSSSSSSTSSSSSSSSSTPSRDEIIPETDTGIDFTQQLPFTGELLQAQHTIEKYPTAESDNHITDFSELQDDIEDRISLIHSIKNDPSFPNRRTFSSYSDIYQDSLFLMDSKCIEPSTEQLIPHFHNYIDNTELERDVSF